MPEQKPHTPRRSGLTRKERTAAKHAAVRKYFYKIYEEKRVRLDDALEETAAAFFYSVETVTDIVFRKREG